MKFSEYHMELKKKINTHWKYWLDQFAHSLTGIILKHKLVKYENGTIEKTCGFFCLELQTDVPSLQEIWSNFWSMVGSHHILWCSWGTTIYQSAYQEEQGSKGWLERSL